MSSLPYLTFGYHKTAIRIQSAQAADLEWFEEFFSPQFEPSKRSPDYVIDLIEDGSRFDNIFALGPRVPEENIAAFILDSGVSELRLWRAPDNSIVVFDSEANVFYQHFSRENRVVVLTRPNNPRRRIWGMKILREIAMARSILNGDHIVHCAALAVDGKGIAIAGEKGAGKTTLLLYILRNSNAIYLANDRAMVWANGPGFNLRGLPTIATVTPKTFQMLPQLRERLDVRRFRCALTIAESLASKSNVTPPPKGKYSFTARQFCDLAEASQAAASPLNVIVFPKITQKSGTILIDRLSADVAIERLKTAKYGIRHGRALSDLVLQLLKRGDDGMSPQTDFWRGLATTVPCYDCMLGVDAYTTGSTVQKLLHKLYRS